ncbi:MAG: hypothetical protein JST80_08995 [Bdellovibrionales bacterium]|nr:hypothetical protein [Bdellovibrionales bacterium]
MRITFLVVLSAVLFSLTSQAYVDYTPNQNLAEEVRDNPYRILPRNSHYSLALDADFFKPTFVGGDNFLYYKWDFYHGNGYWLTARAEFKPVEKLSINLKTLITQGTSSNGPVYNAMFVPLLALTYREELAGFDWETRLSDIGRLTVGTGLFIEQKDTMGGYIMARRGGFAAALMVDGTGSWRLDGGVAALDFSFWDGIVGATAYIQETAAAIQPPEFTWSIYSKRKIDKYWTYGVEAAANQNTWAGMSFVSYDNWLGDPREAGFHYLLKPQIRYYGPHIMGDLAGNVQHNYVSYEQNDKPFTNFMDIMSYGDDVIASAAQVNLEYVFNIFYRVYAETEFVHYNYRKEPDVQMMFFRTGFKFFPFKERQDNFGFMIGNKYLISSSSQIDNNTSGTVRTYTAPNNADLENKPSFLQQTFFMINYNTKL